MTLFNSLLPRYFRPVQRCRNCRRRPLHESSPPPRLQSFEDRSLLSYVAVPAITPFAHTVMTSPVITPDVVQAPAIKPGPNPLAVPAITPLPYTVLTSPVITPDVVQAPAIKPGHNPLAVPAIFSGENAGISDSSLAAWPAISPVPPGASLVPFPAAISPDGAPGL
jgi:hypothetical protein